MKKYLLFIPFVLLLLSCRSRGLNEENLQDSVSSHILNNIDDANTYQSAAFEEMDSLKLKDTDIYKKTKQERIRLEASIASLKDRLSSLEKSGVKRTDHLYLELNDKLKEEQKKLSRVQKALKSYEKKADDYVYTIRHRYQARKQRNDAIMTYDEIFYIDKNGSVIEDVVVYK